MDTKNLNLDEIYMAHYSDAGPGLNGRVFVRDLVDRLLDLPMEAKYTLTMQAGKGYPMAIETRHMIFVAGVGELMRSSMTHNRNSIELTSLQEQQSTKLMLREVGTVRSLIHGLMGLDPKAVLVISGHFYSGIHFHLYPAVK